MLPSFDCERMTHHWVMTIILRVCDSQHLSDVLPLFLFEIFWILFWKLSCRPFDGKYYWQKSYSEHWKALTPFPYSRFNLNYWHNLKTPVRQLSNFKGVRYVILTNVLRKELNQGNCIPLQNEGKEEYTTTEDVIKWKLPLPWVWIIAWKENEMRY